MKNLIFYIICTIYIFNVPLSAVEGLDAYNSLLEKYVTTKGSTALVDYDAWGKDSLHKEVLDYFSTANTSSLEGDEKMAFWINAYNYLTIELIVRTQEKKSIRNQGKLLKNPWKAHSWKLKEKKYTLDEIEHQILRPMNDPRIHFAIVCASYSCPDIRNEVYTAKDLEEQLEDQTRTFLNNEEKGVKISWGKLKITKLFEWFTADFKESGGVLSFIKKYRSDIRASKVHGYLEYSWDLNGTK